MKLLISAVLLYLLTGCAAQAAPVQTETPANSVETLPTIAIEAEAQALADAPEPAVPVILECVPSGEAVWQWDGGIIDYSHTADGYVMVNYTAETDKRLKVRLTNVTTYTYDLTPGLWTVFPLSDGNGSYRLTVYKNVYGSEYATETALEFSAELTDEFAPFLRPNQYVHYTDAPDTMDLGAKLCTGLSHPLEKVAAVYDYVVAEFTYDYDKAAAVKSGYIPVLDQVLAEKSGICFDYAALMTAMLRSQQVPCKLVIGYAGTAYHAWISVWTEENGWVDGAIFFDGQSWKRMDPTFASAQNNSPEILDFIENGSYTTKYLY